LPGQFLVAFLVVVGGVVGLLVVVVLVVLFVPVLVVVGAVVGLVVVVVLFVPVPPPVPPPVPVCAKGVAAEAPTRATPRTNANTCFISLFSVKVYRFSNVIRLSLFLPASAMRPNPSASRGAPSTSDSKPIFLLILLLCDEVTAFLEPSDNFGSFVLAEIGQSVPIRLEPPLSIASVTSLSP
jgi:hypothetical protein